LGANLTDRAALGAVFDKHAKAGRCQNLLARRLPVCAQVDAGRHHYAVAKVDHHAGCVAWCFLGSGDTPACQDKRRGLDDEQSRPDDATR
jgi:hypothetical protein